jgi:hypothetical protein
MLLLRYWTSWLGRLHRAENVGRKFGATNNYNRILVRNGAVFETWLLTDAELVRIRTRSLGNTEDHVKPTALDNLILRWTR